MKAKYILISIIAFLLLTPNAYARCSQSDILRVKSDANKITIDKEQIKDSDGKSTGKFNIIITGLTEDIYVKEDNLGLYKYDVTKNGVLTLYNKEGGNYSFKFYYEICDNKLLKTLNYNLPRYNYYSESSICEGIDPEQVKECGSWYQGELSKEIIQQKIDEYNESLKAKEKKEKINKFFEPIKDFITNNYIYIISALTVIITVTIIIIRRKKQYTLD